ADVQQALAIETERGFCNLQGHTYRFNEYLRQVCHQVFPLQRLGIAYSRYNDLSLSERQHLVQQTHQLLQEIRHQLTLKTIKGIDALKLEKLGLHTVADLIYHFPCDYIDAAHQVPIAQLQLGETVTLVAKVRYCKCFTSPRNPKLTILDIVLEDQTGELRVTRFYSGERYAQERWQEQQKRLYAPYTLVAASGLVKQTPYGLTLDNPQLEVLGLPGTDIDVSRIVPIYPLKQGVSPALIRRAVERILPLVQDYPDPLPQELRDRYQLSPLATALRHIHFPPDHT
ncbi:MAG: DNA helicase RecG, partial [Thermosynechococcus sp.]